MKPGIYYDLAFDKYLAIEALSSHGIGDFLQSPAHYRHARDNPNLDPTPALVFGAAAHCKILENGYCDRFVIKPTDINRRTKAGKIEWAEWQQDNQDKGHLTLDDAETIDLMEATFRKVKTAQGLISKGEPEVSLVWEHPTHGFLCKCRLDWINADKLWVIDYKTTLDASSDRFGRDVVNYGYDVQAAWNSQGVDVLFGNRPKFFFIAQEKAPPFAAKVYHVPQGVLNRGERVADGILDQYVYCLDNGKWPAYPDKVEVLELPRWAR